VTKRRRGIGSRLARPGAALALVAAGLLLSVAFVGIAVQRNAVSREVAALSADIAREQLRHAALEAAVAEKGTEAYVADKARELGFVRPGEGLIALQGAPRAGAPAATADERPGRLARWIALFFGTR